MNNATTQSRLISRFKSQLDHNRFKPRASLLANPERTHSAQYLLNAIAMDFRYRLADDTLANQIALWILGSFADASLLKRYPSLLIQCSDDSLREALATLIQGNLDIALSMEASQLTNDALRLNQFTPAMAFVVNNYEPLNPAHKTTTELLAGKRQGNLNLVALAKDLNQAHSTTNVIQITVEPRNKATPTRAAMPNTRELLSVEIEHRRKWADQKAEELLDILAKLRPPTHEGMQ